MFRLPNLLPHLPLPGDPDYLPAPWVPLVWAPSVVLAVSAAGCQGWCYERVLPSCPVLTMSRGFAVGPGQLSGIAFIVNAGDVGLSCFP